MKTLSFLVIINGVATLIGVLESLSIYQAFNINNNFLLTLRYVQNYGDFSFGILEYFFLLSQFTTFFINILINFIISDNKTLKKLKVLRALSFLISIINIILSTGRTTILLFIIGLITTTYLLGNKKIKKIHLISSLIIFVFLFGLYSFVLNKGVSSNGNLLTDLYYNISFYLSSGIQSLDFLIANKDSLMTGGLFTFRTLFAILNQIGINVEVVNLVKEFTPTNLSSNVYSVYEIYLRDFGFAGVFLIQFLLGIIYAYVFNRLKNGKIKYLLIYSMLMYSLVMQPFQDQYFSLLSTYIQIIIITFIFFNTKIFLGDYNFRIPIRRTLLYYGANKRNVINGWP